MKYQTFTDTPQSTYPVAILAPKLAQQPMAQEYLEPIALNPNEVVAYELYKPQKKTPATVIRDYLDDLIPLLDDLACEYLLVGDGDYFKALTGVNKADAYLGYVLPNVFPVHMSNQFKVIYVPNYRQVFYDPHRTKAKIMQGLEALYDHRHGQYREPGCSIIHFSAYPDTAESIEKWLQRLIDMDQELTCDIEGFSLKHYSAGIGTIAFAWSQHEGIAFPVDLGPDGVKVRKLLKQFFMTFPNCLTFHNISYDACVLIYQIFMSDIIDTEGLLEGLDYMTRNFHDTKIIAYLATNSCAGNSLGLKDLSQEFAGNYAVEEIKDITKVPLPELLQYNLVDCLSTWYVKNTYWDIMVQDQQLDLYNELFKPALIDIIQMQLTGMPVNLKEVQKTKAILEQDRTDALHRIQSDALVQDFTEMLKDEAEEERYRDWEERKNNGVKVRPYTSGNFSHIEFNPNSPPQKQRLLYEILNLPIIERTKTKQPGTGADVLEKLKAYTQNQDTINLIDAFLDFAAVEKIYTTFIPVMGNAVPASDGAHYIFGNFNLGGTISGRLSSSDPNLQTIPSSGTRYAKIIKKCFVAPDGWVMIGLDFNSLEDMISALTTKDPMKLKVYTDGFDGHCLRAHSYFGDQMSNNINPEDPASINSIKDMYPQLRQDSKMPTFALTYQGTFITLMAKGGFPEKQAKLIEARYHNLYRVSDQWVSDRLDEASRKGYIEGAFGLRVRTPLLAQVIRGNSKTPHEAEAEGRTAGNALGQSWCLLNTRASVEFMRKVRASIYRLLIRPIAHIHDAQYYLIPDDLDVLMYVNKYLVKAVQWQKHPAIQHPTVKIGGELSVFYPNWSNEISIPNHAGRDQILDRIASKVPA